MKLYDVPQIGAKMYLRDETDLWGFLQNGEYEPAETKLVQSIVKKDWICFDVGANIGYYTILMAKRCKEVYAFEAEPENYKVLLMNKMANGTKNAYLLERALSEHKGLIPLYLCDKSHGMHRTYKSKHCHDVPIMVKSLRLDDCSQPDKIDFIKMDIEGSEYQALNGMVKTIEKHHPTMLIEFHPPTLEEAGTKPEDEYNFLVNLGYKITLVPDIPINSYQQLDKLTRDESGGKNIICTQ
jgi:FkbM family methyltransferase